MTQLVFARQSSGSDAYLEHSGERLLNCYARPFPDGGVGPFIIAFSPGLTRLALLASGRPVRAVYSQRGVVYAACDGGLWTWDGVEPVRVASIGDDELTTISGNGIEVFVASGGRYHVWDGETFSTVSPGSFENVQNVAAMDGYALIFEKNGERFAVSGIQDAASVDALDFASAEGAPDYIVRGHVDHSELWVFGTRSTEIWSNTGNADFPFSRLSGGKLDRGCAFAGSVASEDNSVFWVGDDRVVYRANGYQPQRVSTQWVESILQGLSNVANVQAFTFTLDGAKVYALRLPGRPALLYDIASGLWHERGTGVDGGEWLAMCATRCEARGVVYGGSDGWLHSAGGVTDGGETILREGVSLPLSQGRERLTVHEAQLNFRTGATDIGRDVKVMLQASKDGRVWNKERWRPMGLVGEYDRLVRWHRFGQARQWRFRFRITDPISGALYGATVRM